ncbi:MAG: S41 family peptidase [Omnitrophica WOR_2 bacterium]
MKQSYALTLFGILCLAIGFFAGFLTHAFAPAFHANFPLLQEAYLLLRDHGINPLPAPPALEYGMIKGMVQAYGDPFTSFVEPVQTVLESNLLQGSYGGIGVRLGNDADGHYILYPYPDSPASKAGVREGDRLLAVGALSIQPGTPLDQIQVAIRGPSGKKVSITIGRAPDYLPQVFDVSRQDIPIPSVTWHIDPGKTDLGVFEVNIIAASTPDEIQKAVKDLQDRGATHFVMDLRDNGGGLLTAGVDVARLFLKDGEVIQQQYRDQGVETSRVEKPGLLDKLPLAILVNQNTASAAEIIAGSLQARHRAVLIGTPTFGKNTIQLVYNLEDKSSLHVTAAKWWIPGLEFPKGDHGLTPDFNIPTDNKDPQLVIKKAIQALYNQP